MRKTAGREGLLLTDLAVVFPDAETPLTEGTKRLFVPFTLKRPQLEPPLSYFFAGRNSKKYQEIFVYLLTFRKELFQLEAIWRVH